MSNFTKLVDGYWKRSNKKIDETWQQIEKDESGNITGPQGLVEQIAFENGQLKTNQDAESFLASTDWQVIRHRDQLASGESTSLTEEEYQALLTTRQEKRDLIVR